MTRPGPHAQPDPHDREHELAERGRALVAAATARVHAGEGLRSRIEADRERLRPVRRRRAAGFAAATTAAAAAVVATFVVALGGGEEPPTVLETARVTGDATPTMGAPAPDTSQPVLLRASIDGVRFPQWDELGWPAVGARRDEIGGREAMTVFYEGRRGKRVAYTILEGEPLPTPSDAYRREAGGTEMSVLHQAGRTVVVWTRGDHTCVMTAPDSVSEHKLLDLAGWDAGGAVPF